MKSIKFLSLTILASLFLAACNSSAPAENTQVEAGISGTFNADLTASSIAWEGNMLKMYNHTGTLSLLSGSVGVENNTITSGEFVVDMKSMTTTDANYDSAAGHTPDQLIGHLSTGDFFLVDSFPTASFKVTGSDSTGVMGNLTIKGITNAEKITSVLVTKTETGIKATGDLTFDRTKYSVSYQNAVKEKVLSNDIILKIELVAAP